MPLCTSQNRDGTTCTRVGRYFEGNCGTHHNSKLARDPAYAARFAAYETNIEEQAAARLQQEEVRRQQEVAAQEAREEEKRERKRIKNEQSILEAPLASPNTIMKYARDLFTIWNVSNIPGYTFPQAYAVIKYTSSTHQGFPELMRAVVRIARQGFQRHHIHAVYMDIPPAEREEAIATLNVAVAVYGEIDIHTLIPEGDPIKPIVRRRQELEEQQRLAAERQARNEQFENDLRQNPVVFQRDPEGSINLAAFAADNQSVHRSSVQDTTHRAILALIERPLGEGQDTLSEITADFNNPEIVRFATETVKEKIVLELTNDYFNTEAFSLRYGDVVDHVWAYIRTHIHRTGLVLRLAQEVGEGRRMCSNGKMARLVNVLQGYDDTLVMEAPKELFQGRFALLRDRPLEMRRELANALFEEFHIPDVERPAWLEPLLAE